MQSDHYDIANWQHQGAVNPRLHSLSPDQASEVFPAIRAAQHITNGAALFHLAATEIGEVHDHANVAAGQRPGIEFFIRQLEGVVQLSTLRVVGRYMNQ